MNSVNLFEKNRYLVVKDFFNQYDILRMSKRMRILSKNKLFGTDPQCPLSDSIYSDPVHSEMQEMYRCKIEELIGYKLFPTYAYSRIYSPKEVLESHKDRPSCEISLTATLDYDTFDNEPWDIFIEPNNSYKLYPGDALIYKGCELYHWRKSFVGVHQTQTFFHYVDANGPYKAFKYDFRPSLGSSIETKNFMMEEEEYKKLGISR